MFLSGLGADIYGGGYPPYVFYSWVYKFTGEKKSPENFAPKNAKKGSREVYGSFSVKIRKKNNATEKIQGGVVTVNGLLKNSMHNECYNVLPLYNVWVFHSVGHVVCL